jgi:hypothetical protein
MTDSDEILSGFFIAGVSLTGIIAIGYYIKNKCKKTNIKESRSHDDLVSIEDPQSNSN